MPATAWPVEGYVLYRQIDVYYGQAATSDAAGVGAAVPGERSLQESSVQDEAPKEKNDGIAFVYRATQKNSRGDYTYISDPSIDANPNAVVLVTRSSGRGGAGDGAYDHNIGVWYEEPVARKWVVFNQDRAAVPAGATFKVVVPQVSRGSSTALHQRTPSPTKPTSTILSPITAPGRHSRSRRTGTLAAA